MPFRHRQTASLEGELQPASDERFHEPQGENGPLGELVVDFVCRDDPLDVLVGISFLVDHRYFLLITSGMNWSSFS